MYNYIIIHGSYGTPFENWFSWLFKKLSENEQNKVLAPQFPCGEGVQNYENWARVMDAYKSFIDENTVFIGHSLSPAFIVDYILDNNLKVNKLFFAAPFYGLINIPDFDKVNEPFFRRDDLEKIKDHVNSSTCFISNNDPYVPNELSEIFSDKINAKKIYVKNAGHFNTAAGYDKFVQLYDEIMNHEK